jgi:hypothetical protein
LACAARTGIVSSGFCPSESNQTYCCIFKADTAAQNLGDDRCPGSDVSRLSLRVDVDKVLDHFCAQSELSAYVPQVVDGEERGRTYGTSRSRTPVLVARCASLGSLYILKRTLMSVAAALDSCLSKFGNCLMKPIPSAVSPALSPDLSQLRQTHPLSTTLSLDPYPR